MEEKVIRNVPMTEFKLNGTPWYSSGHESVDSRKLLATIIQSLSKIGWKFHACVNIKGGTDTLFFIYTPHQVSSCLKLFNSI